MSEFPRTDVGGVSLSRMIIGTNWFLGWSHTSKAKDNYIKSTQTAAKIADVFEVFLSAGVDTVMGPAQAPKFVDAVRDAQDRTGRKMILVATPTLNVADGQAATDENQRMLDQHVQWGATFCMPHQCTTDALLDKTQRKIRKMDAFCRMIRQRGMVPGLSTHMPEAVVYADESGLDVETYIQIYNAAGFLMHVEVDWVHRVIQKAAKPVMTIKPLAAGRLLPLVGLAFAWATLRPIDMVTVGTMTGDEARECIDISLSVLQGRPPAVELQRTRSKSALDGK